MHKLSVLSFYINNAFHPQVAGAHHERVVVAVVGKLPLVPPVGGSVHESLQEGEPQAEGVGQEGGEDRPQLLGVPHQRGLARGRGGGGGGARKSRSLDLSCNMAPLELSQMCHH